MKVYKFGGASVKDAEGVRNVSGIIRNCDDRMVVVVSAMGKMTNAFEGLVHAYYNRQTLVSQLTRIKTYHQEIVEALLGVQGLELIEGLFSALEAKLDTEPSLNFDFEYDQIVPYGELLSTRIVSAYLNHDGLLNQWTDVRKYLRTDDEYRSAGVNWTLTTKLMKEAFTFEGNRVYVTQGFIGSTENNLSTTLGREGSDYTGAIIAYALTAESLSIWKDVPGVLNADPRWYPKATLINELSYWEAIELTYYGAQVIHPKTMKPLQNKKIPLLVKSFLDPALKGTAIRATEQADELGPIFVLKRHQTLLSLSPKDFSFIMEENLSEIFQTVSRHRLKINLMQSSALNFSMCVDSTDRVQGAIDELSRQYGILYNTDMELVTIRHYDDAAIAEMISSKDVVDSQVSRKTARYVVKASAWFFEA